MANEISPRPSVGGVVDLLHEWFPPASAEPWDAVGLVWGERSRPCRRVAFAVDPVLPVADEAAQWRADLLVVHHPLFLKGVHGFSDETPKGRTLSRLVSSGCALLTAHTNADIAEGGVSEVLARHLGLERLRPLQPSPGPALDQVVVYVPRSHAPGLRVALHQAGAGSLGNYDSCSFSSEGTGRFRPLDGATPTIGEIGTVEEVVEERVEMIAPRRLRAQVVEAIYAAHPYEEPAWNVIEMADAQPVSTGLGRIGEIDEMPLAEFARHVASRLPASQGAIRVGGDVNRPIRRVAVLGGAGDSMLAELSTSDVDVYLTSDLRHHPALEFLEKDGPALIDVPHWAAEWTWLPAVAERLRLALDDTVETYISQIVTDPWRLRV